MGRTLVCDTETKGSLMEWIGDGEEHFGLIVGQISSSSSSSSSASEDFVAFLAPTLAPQEDKAELEASDEEEEDTDSLSDEPKRRPSPSPPAAIVLSELTSGWVTHHSQQLTRLLTGGLDVIGVFVVCSPEALADLSKSGKLRSFLHAAEKRAARRREPLAGSGGHPSRLRRHQFQPIHADRYVIHGCTRTKSLSVKTADLGQSAIG